VIRLARDAASAFVVALVTRLLSLANAAYARHDTRGADT
jgi:hypothetical protein